MNKRKFELFIGGQAAGKTYTIKRRIRHLAHLSSISSVFIFDRLHEYSSSDFFDIDALEVENLADFVSLRKSDTLPQVVIFRFGTDHAQYEWALTFAVECGDVYILIDEAYDFLPTASRWPGSDVLRDIVYAGRHLRAADGELRPTHIGLAAQYPRTLYLGAWQQASTILATKLEGESNRRWIVDNFGAEKWNENQKLKLYRWGILRGEMPRFGPHN